MAEASRFWTTNGTGDGPSGGYTAQQFYDFLRKVLITDQGAAQGVLLGEQGELACSGTASPIVVAAGSAIAYGFFYENTSNLNLSVTTPVVGTTGGRVNLKVDWTAQTVRAVAVRNTDGISTPPALVQTPGTQWDVPLYTFTITTGGVISLTNVRTFSQFGTQMITAMIADDAVTAAKIATGAVGNAELATDAVSADKIAAGAVGSSELASGAVIAGKIASGGVSTTAELANDIVDDTKVGNRVPQAYRRQGGDATDWDVPGTTTYTPTTVRMQMGARTISAGGTTITFPVAFGAAPDVVAIVINTSSARFPVIFSIVAGSFTVFVYDAAGTAVSEDICWIAVGAE